MVLGSLEQGAGGEGANQAVAAERAGARVQMVGAVGDDAAAALVLAPLEDAGVDTSGVRRVPGGTTGTALVCADDDGENTIVVVAGANAVLGEDDVRRACADLGTGDVLLCQLEVPLEVVRPPPGRRADGGACVVLNAAPALPGVAPVLGDVDVLVVNEHEASLLASQPDPVTAARLRTGTTSPASSPSGRPASSCAAPARTPWRSQHPRSTWSTRPVRATRSSVTSSPAWPVGSRCRRPCRTPWRQARSPSPAPEPWRRYRPGRS